MEMSRAYSPRCDVVEVDPHEDKTMGRKLQKVHQKVGGWVLVGISGLGLEEVGCMLLTHSFERNSQYEIHLQ
jgi:hypothetical protein